MQIRESYFDTQGRALQGNLNDFSKKLNRTLSFKMCAFKRYLKLYLILQMVNNENDQMALGFRCEQ